MTSKDAFVGEDVCSYYIADVFTTERIRCILPKNHQFYGREEHLIDQKKFMKG